MVCKNSSQCYNNSNGDITRRNHRLLTLLKPINICRRLHSKEQQQLQYYTALAAIDTLKITMNLNSEMVQSCVQMILNQT